MYYIYKEEKETTGKAAGMLDQEKRD